MTSLASRSDVRRLWPRPLAAALHLAFASRRDLYHNNHNKKDGYRQQNVRQRQKIISIRGLSRSLKLMPFKNLGAVSYSPSIVTMCKKVLKWRIFKLPVWITGKRLKIDGYIQGIYAFHSNYGRICSHFRDIQRQRMAWPWNLGMGSFKVIEVE